MAKKQRHWFWNILIGITIIASILAFTVHYKNWTKIEQDHIKILSGLYYQNIAFKDVNTVAMVERIPSMERVNGFSAMQKEKGVFKDSILGTNIYVYVDDLKQQKIKLIHHDSLQLFLNFADSLETKKIFDVLSLKIEENTLNNPK